MPELSQNKQLEKTLLALLETEDNLLKIKIVKILRYFVDKIVIENLVRLLASSNLAVSLGAAESLRAMPYEVIVEYLHELKSLYLSEHGSLAIGVTESIQSQCGFYNYEVAQLNLEIVSSQSSLSGSPIFNIQQLGNLNTGPITIHGDQKGFG